MKKNNLVRYFTFISFLTLLAIFFHIVQKSYGNLMQASIEVEKNPLLKTVHPNLNTDILPTIEQRKEFLQ